MSSARRSANDDQFQISGVRSSCSNVPWFVFCFRFPVIEFRNPTFDVMNSTLAGRFAPDICLAAAFCPSKRPAVERGWPLGWTELAKEAPEFRAVSLPFVVDGFGSWEPAHVVQNPFSAATSQRNSL